MYGNLSGGIFLPEGRRVLLKVGNEMKLDCDALVSLIWFNVLYCTYPIVFSTEGG